MYLWSLDCYKTGFFTRLYPRLQCTVSRCDRSCRSKVSVCRFPINLINSISNYHCHEYHAWLLQTGFDIDILSLDIITASFYPYHKKLKLWEKIKMILPPFHSSQVLWWPMSRLNNNNMLQLMCLKTIFLHFYCRLLVGVSVAVSLEFKQKIIQIYLSPSIDISWLWIKNACTHQTLTIST